MIYRKSLLPIAGLQLLAAYLPTALNIAPSIGERATQEGIPPELPLGPFFAIWGLILLAYTIFAIYAFTRATELSRRLAKPLALAGLGTAFWMPLQQIVGNPILDLLAILPIGWVAWLAAYRFDTMRGLGGSAIKWTADVLTGLLSGWLTVATAISVPRAGRYMLGQGPTDSEWISLWSVLAVVSMATAVYKRYISRTLWYYWAAGWGLLGIIMNNWLRTDFGYFLWITLFFGLWLIYRRWATGALGSTSTYLAKQS